MIRVRRVRSLEERPGVEEKSGDHCPWFRGRDPFREADTDVGDRGA